MNKDTKRKALKAAFPLTLPVLTGYVFLGITYGMLMVTQGFPMWLPTVTALIIYTGSMEFLMVSILASSFHPASAFATAIMVGARHLFYGISMLGKYRRMGWKKFYLIYTTSDETFSINYSVEVPDNVDRSWFYFWVSFLDQMYWVAGATIGALFGSLITVDMRGLDFVMTAMFMVIFLQQWMKDGTNRRTVFRDHSSEIIGVAGSAICRLIFGPDHFMIPSMIVILLCLLALRKPLERIADEREVLVSEMEHDAADTLHVSQPVDGSEK
ncbi:MAG: AzlC family ABC transporter permease [Lachnospiraceae bacterium]|nr:AzlC family ABC transporter permease [Lachnospiraceae bacterium]